MKNLPPPCGWLLHLAVLATLTSSIHTVRGVEKLFDFESGRPSDAVFAGSANVVSGVGIDGSAALQLTANENQQRGLFIVPGSGNYPIESFAVSFKMFIGGGDQADGLSFNFAPDLPNDAADIFWEEGAGSGISVCFDTYDNGGGEAPAIDLKVGGTTVASRTDVLDRFRTGAFVDVRIELSSGDSSSSLSLTIDDQLIFLENLPEGLLFRGDFGFGGRTGGRKDAHVIDDLSITFDCPIEGAVRSTALLPGVVFELFTDDLSPVSRWRFLADLPSGESVEFVVQSGDPGVWLPNPTNLVVDFSVFAGGALLSGTSPQQVNLAATVSTPCGDVTYVNFVNVGGLPLTTLSRGLTANQTMSGTSSAGELAASNCDTFGSGHAYFGLKPTESGIMIVRSTKSAPENSILIAFTEVYPRIEPLACSKAERGELNLQLPVSANTLYWVGVNSSEELELNLSYAAQPPVFGSLPGQQTNEDVPLTVNFTVSDPDTPPEGLNVTATSDNPAVVPPEGLVISGTGNERTLTITPASQASGTVQITLLASDGTSSGSQSFTLVVHPVADPPTISSLPGQQTNEDVPLTVNFTVSDPDTPPEGLNVTATSDNPAVVPLEGLVISGTGNERTLTITPASQASGTVQITLWVTDGQLGATQSFALVVHPVADPPTISSLPGQQTNEDVPLTVNFTVSDPDTPPEGLNVTATSDNPAVVPLEGLVISGTGNERTLTITPASQASGTVQITLLVSDGTSNVSDGFSLTFEAPAQPPQFAQIRLTPQGEIELVIIGGGSARPLRLEYSEDLEVWIALQTINDAIGPFTFSESTGQRARFYRIRSE